MYAKIFRQIFDSSLAEDHNARHIFMDLLVLADSAGVVNMTYQAIARRINVPVKIVRDAICKLCKPDPDSRSQKHGGARLILLDEDRAFGWMIVNYEAYRSIVDEDARREYMRVYMKNRRRSKKKSKQPVNSRKPVLTPLTQEEAEEEEEEEENKDTAVSADAKTRDPVKEFFDYWKSKPSLRQFQAVGDGRKRKARARLKSPQFAKSYRAAIDNLSAEDSWASSQRWCGIDWFIANDTNWRKALEGNYRGRDSPGSLTPEEDREIGRRAAEEGALRLEAKLAKLRQ